jgi:Macrocin-O-methyltransferase (TylF)
VQQDTIDIWDAYNMLLLSPDVERLRKLIVRHELLRQTLDVPGDVVECGVLKGAGLMLWLKLLEIMSPGTNKRVVGFDTFEGYAGTDRPDERGAASAFLAEADYVSTDVAALERAAAAVSPDRVELVAGDVTVTAAEYAKANPGFRVSLLHLDLDVYAPTLAALEALYPRVVRGGLIVFDEYADNQWGESDAVDEFFADMGVRLRTVPWSRKPTAFLVKT